MMLEPVVPLAGEAEVGSEEEEDREEGLSKDGRYLPLPQPASRPREPGGMVERKVEIVGHGWREEKGTGERRRAERREELAKGKMKGSFDEQEGTSRGKANLVSSGWEMGSDELDQQDISGKEFSSGLVQKDSAERRKPNVVDLMDVCLLVRRRHVWLGSEREGRHRRLL
jgi:hypothetical protein